MQAKKQSSTRSSARTRPLARTTDSITSRTVPRESAFSALFLDRARRRELDALAKAGTRAGLGRSQSDTPLARHARWVGPWEVEPVAAGGGVLHAATRRSEPVGRSGEGGGSARMACRERQDALLGAATFVTLATPNNLTLKTHKRSAHGHPIHDGPRHVGHISPAVEGSEEAFLVAYHALRCLAANPDAAALFLEALDPETLALLGRAVMCRLR